MSAQYVLDASAVLAMLHREPGADAVAAIVGASAISAVNWSEVVQKAASHGVDVEGLADGLGSIGLDIVAFELAEAEAAARLWRGAERLSLADRACLATAARLDAPAVTADRAWLEVDLPVEVRPIR